MIDDNFTVKKTPVLLMIVFDILTLGTYSCCWFLTRRDSLNQLSKAKKLGKTAFILCILLNIIGIVLIVASGALEGFSEATGDLAYAGMSAILNGVDNSLNLVIGITLIVQSFKVKSILESYLNSQEAGHNPFAISLSSAGTFFLRTYYLQYRINKIHRNSNPKLDPTRITPVD